MATEALPDPEPLRVARRERTLAAMEAHGLDLLVLGRVANIRYTSGVPVLWNAGTRPFGPGAVIARETGDVYVMSTWDEGVPEEIPHDHLFGITWNPMNYVEVLERIAGEFSPRRVGTDATSPLFAQLMPMAFGEAEIVDGGPALRDARRIKVGPEIEAIRGAAAVAEAGLAAAVGALEPGATERGLTGLFMDTMASHGVTTPATQDVVRVSSRGADSEGVIRSGDLVTFAAGVVAAGYSADIGRTWPVDRDDDRPGVHDLLARLDDLRSRLIGACTPGVPGASLLDAYAAAGEPVPRLPVAHGLGLGFDDPVIVGDLPVTAASERLDPGVVIALTATVADAAVGTATARDVVHITAGTPDVLTASPFWASN